jgi:hypothetical protein
MLKGFTFLSIISAFLLLICLIDAPVLSFMSFVDEKIARADIGPLTEMGNGMAGEVKRAVKKEGDSAATELVAASSIAENISPANLVRLVAAAVSAGATQGLQP